AAAQHGEKLLGEPLQQTFLHRQTLAGQIRFTTTELCHLESKIASAADPALALELEMSDLLLAIAVASWTAVPAAALALALIAVLAQTGSFVPARRARIGIIDRLFSRVGAADDLARGRSTFMVEMVETAAILNQASPRSLVILDEIGRGTATFDGLSIAWATI